MTRAETVAAPPDPAVDAQIDELIEREQFTLTLEEKQRALVPILIALMRRNMDACAAFQKYLRSYKFDVDRTARIEDFIPLHVSAFKNFELRTVAASDVVRELHSSGTRSQTPSRIFLDKRTLHRQTRALIAILKAQLGARRRPYLVLDVPESNDASRAALLARGAAIRGFETFASETTYALRAVGDDYELDAEAVTRFARAHANVPVLVFGFTFLVWSRALPALEKLGALGLSGAAVFHGGGWKKLEAEQVSKERFSSRVAEALGCSAAAVHDFYGMVEQVGSVFIDCPAGNKHAPNFAEVIIRDPRTFEPVPVGGEGLIEVISVLPSSYPGQCLLTDDQGVLVALDDCPCGRRGRAFRFTSRVLQAELRGCGDVIGRAMEGR